MRECKTVPAATIHKRHQAGGLLWRRHRSPPSSTAALSRAAAAAACRVAARLLLLLLCRPRLCRPSLPQRFLFFFKHWPIVVGMFEHALPQRQRLCVEGAAVVCRVRWLAWEQGCGRASEAKPMQPEQAEKQSAEPPPQRPCTFSRHSSVKSLPASRSLSTQLLHSCGAGGRRLCAASVSSGGHTRAGAWQCGSLTARGRRVHAGGTQPRTDGKLTTNAVRQPPPFMKRQKPQVSFSSSSPSSTSPAAACCPAGCSAAAAAAAAACWSTAAALLASAAGVSAA